MASKTAHNPPAGECTQCWYHAHAGREAHARLAPREDCPACVDHMLNGHGGMIVRG
ncbi:pRL2-8 [Streptomyces sp. NPDC058378]|uniref:pRL2-8 n=1 Tax=Streptomyces sp. NPDC058378 TaxID=3346469 RepID=UPI00364CBDD3